MPHFWIPAFESRDGLRPGGILSSSILDTYLMSAWYDFSIHESTQALYVDSYTAGAFDYDVDMDAIISSYRQRYFLPPVGPCKEQAIAFMVVHSNRFLACFMDVAKKMVHLLAAGQEDEQWEEWSGPRYYCHICRLNGWTSGDISKIKIIPVHAKQVDAAHCSILALSLVMQVIERGLITNRKDQLIVRSKCQHLIRKEAFEHLLGVIRNSYQYYGFLYKTPPPQWSSWSEHDVYEAIRDDRYMDLQRVDDIATLQLLCLAIERCNDCQIHISSLTPYNTNAKDNRFCGGRDRLQRRGVLKDPSLESDSDQSTIEVRNRYPTSKHAKRPNATQILPALGRFQRPKHPPALPSQHPVFPAHDHTFDDYCNGPTRDAILPDALEYGSLVAKHRMFKDYGFRLLSRFAHAFYMLPPIMVSDHIFAIGTSLDYVPTSCMDLPLTSKSRSFVGDAHPVAVHDSVEMGVKEMLAAAGSCGSKASQDVFVRGRNPRDGKFIRLNMERDHQAQHEQNLKISAEIDSFVFVGRQIRVHSAVKLYVTTSISQHAPIRQHNHIYVELLLPLTMEERLEYGHNRPSFLEKKFSLSQIPHMCFADLGEGVYVYVFFPRATHNKPNSGFKDASISYLDQRFFLERVVLPALHQHASAVSMARYGYDADGFNQKTTSQKYVTGNKGTPRGLAVAPDVFHKIQKTMRTIVDQDQDGPLAAYGSFFFVLEGKGVGLHSLVNDLAVSPPDQPFRNLVSHFSKIDWDFILDRNNGESYFDVALCIYSDSSLVGVWRLDALEASFGAGGFLSGKQFPLNTMGYYGSMQAEMGEERCRHTHIRYRSSYLSFYNLSRNFDNRPWAPTDLEAYHFSRCFQDVWDSRMCEYKKQMDKPFGYGVRDEYRIGGQALKPFLNGILDKVQMIFFTPYNAMLADSF